MNIITSDAPIFERDGLVNFIDTSIEDQIVPMIWGPPGVGKTQLIEWYAEHRGYNLITVHGGQYHVHSAFGVVVPNLDEKTSFFTMPDYVERAHDAGGKVLLFIDEAPNADKAVTPAYLQLFDEHRVGEHRLPDDCEVVAAGNRPEDGAHATNMAATAANRLAHGVYEGANVAEFCEFGEASGRLSIEVMAYLFSNTDALYDFDKTRAINNTHRTWEMASRRFDAHRAAGGDPMCPIHLSNISSRILRTTATDMALTMALAGMVTPIEAIRKDPDGAPLPEERDDLKPGDVLAANYMQMRVCNQALTDDKAMAEAVGTYIGRMVPELRAAFVAMAMRRYNEQNISVGVIGVIQKRFKQEFVDAVDKVHNR